MTSLSVIQGGRIARRHRGARAFGSRTPAAEMLRRRLAWRVGPGVFEVISRDSLTRYKVFVTPAGATACTCTAGRFGRPCWHRRVVRRRVAREGAGQQ